MNIKEAKEQIKNAMTAYFTKDEFGNYAVPVEKQRPVFLMGPPGIGKTAIMEQIAQELDVCLVSYSMTHHTRQSALGLPFIEKKVFDGKEYQVSEYTMSEIIASVYETMEATGKKEGILFLDEINCVSETLAPSMLQFLQYKIFGRHRVPEGWIVVTAGNPPEYNRSVREFDIVTWDRLKRIDVEPDFDAWKEFAYQKHVHPAVMTYLEIRKGDFYKVESTVNGKRFVTARGWDDLSQMIHLYEQNHLPVDEKLIISTSRTPRSPRSSPSTTTCSTSTAVTTRWTRSSPARPPGPSASGPPPPRSTRGCPCGDCCWTPSPTRPGPWWSGRRCCGSCWPS